jgi:hypothetical protein
MFTLYYVGIDCDLNGRINDLTSGLVGNNYSINFFGKHEDRRLLGRYVCSWEHI